MSTNDKETQVKTIDLYNLIVRTKLIHSEQFVPWNMGNMQGMYRKLVFSRDSLLGEVSKYYFEDYVIWKYQDPEDYKKIQKDWNGNYETFLSRFIFLHPSLPFYYKRKSIWFGFRGYMDLIICPFPLHAQDLKRKEIYDIAIFLREN
ncbi:MAG: hypothetical protein ACP5UA_07175 [Candidatus Hydrogenedens sp.]